MVPLLEHATGLFKSRLNCHGPQGSDSASNGLMPAVAAVWACFGKVAYSQSGRRPSSGRFRPRAGWGVARQEGGMPTGMAQSLRRPVRVGGGSHRGGRPRESGRDRQDVSTQPLVQFGGKAPGDVEHTALATTLGLEVSQKERAEDVKYQHRQ